MYVAALTREDKIAYGTYLMLRECAPKANLITLRQISVYIARSGFVNDISSDFIIEYNEEKDVSVVSLINGITIEFDDYSGNFDFIITRKDRLCSVRTVVSLNNPNDLSTVNVYSELKIKRNGMYVVAFRPKDVSDENALKFGTINYYTNDEIDWVCEIIDDEIDNNFDIIAKRNGIFPFAEQCCFDLLSQTDMVLDCYQGYISNMLMRIDLLYENIKYLNVNKKKRKKK